MRSYVFEWSVQNGELEMSDTFGGRVYKDDTSARRAAMTMFRHRSQDLNDEILVYEGRVNVWGNADGRYVGKIAYDAVGVGYRWFPA